MGKRDELSHTPVLQFDDQEFLELGCTICYDFKLLDMIPAPTDDWISENTGLSYPKEYNLDQAAYYISDKYLPLHAKLGYYNYWEGSEPTAMEWHNDHIEGCDVFFIYFITDVNKGGELMFRKTGGNITGIIQPRRGLLVKGTQKVDFEHIAVYTNELRYVCNFGFKVEWI